MLAWPDDLPLGPGHRVLALEHREWVLHRVLELEHREWVLRPVSELEHRV